jgi:NAD(P)-dependent dehydrogenase (short-subunit alcohol dehydrogenase family)
LLAEQLKARLTEPLEILVLNAGVSKAAPLAAYSADDLDTLFHTNVRGPFLLVQQLAPSLGERSNVVVVTSVVARTVVGAPASTIHRSWPTRPPRERLRRW